MVADGLMELVPSRHRRSLPVQLTEEGAEALDALGFRQAAWVHRVAADLSPGQIDRATELLAETKSRRSA